MVLSVPERSFWPVFSSPDGLVGAGVFCGLCYSICTRLRRKRASCTGNDGLGLVMLWGKQRTKTDPFGQKRLVFGPSLRFRKAIESSFKGQGYEANSYLTCHPNFNKVLVSLLYQLALFPFQGWDLTRSSVGLYNSRMPLVERKFSALGAAWPEDRGLEEMVAVLQG